jgi:hypothetical protein
VTSQFAKIVSNLSSALFRTITLIFQVTQFAAGLNAGSLVSCHNFLSFLLCVNKGSMSAISYFRCKIVVFLVDTPYAEATETAKSRVAVSASLEGEFG